MKRYLKRYFWEFTLCFLVSSGLSVNVFAGYEMSDPRSGNLFAVTGAGLLAMAMLFSAHFNKKGIRISAPVTVAMLTAEAVALYYTGAFSGVSPIDDNPVLFWIIVATASIAVFWTSRSRPGLVILFLAGTFMTAAFDFLKYPVLPQGYFVMILGIAALFLYRVHDRSMSCSNTGKVKFGAYFVQPVALSLIAFLLAAGVYFGAVRPLAPPVDETELVQKLMSMQIFKDAGISSIRVVVADKPEDPVMTSPDRKEEFKKEQTKQDERNGNGGRLGNSGDFMEVMAITYQKHADKIGITAAVFVLLAILAFPVKLLLRKKWYAGLLRKPNEEYAVALYLHIVKKLKKAGFKRPKDLTLLEYAVDSRERLDKFSVYDADFLRLTLIYLKMIYGYQQISDEERELFHDFYKEFYKNLRTEMGNLRYCIQFFTI